MNKLSMVILLAIILISSNSAYAQNRCLSVKLNKVGTPIVSLVKKNKKGKCRKGSIDQLRLVAPSTLEYGQVIAAARITDFGTPAVRSLGGSKTSSASVVRTDTGTYEVTFQGDFTNITSPEQIIRSGTAEFFNGKVIIANVTNTANSLTVLVYTLNGDVAQNSYFNIVLTYGELVF